MSMNELREILPVTSKKRRRHSMEAAASAASSEDHAEGDHNDPESFVAQNAYRGACSSAYSLCTRFSRPLPFSESLMDMSEASQSLSPLLRDYYASLGKDPPKLLTKRKGLGETNQADDDNDDNDDEEEENNLPEDPSMTLSASSLDQPRHSVLTDRQHARYLQWSSVPPTARNDRNEFKKIRKLVQQERDLYQRALAAFWMAQKDRFLHMATKAQPLVQDWLTHMQEQVASYMSTRFGKCRQVISMVDMRDNKFANLTLETLNSRILCQSGPCPMLESLPAVPLDNISPNMATSNTTTMLRDDQIALALAQQQRVDVVLPESVLRRLVPFVQSQPTTRLGSLLLGVMRPAAFSKFLVIEEPLVMTCATLRQTLKHAYQHNLYRLLKRTAMIGEDTQGPASYQYTFMEFPRPPKPSLRVLVRSRIPVMLRQRPLHLSVRMEFFPERGRHLTTESERANWILDHFLQGQSAVACVDPSSGSILEWKEPSLADALTATTSESIQRQLATTNKATTANATDPLDCWKSVAHFLASLTTVGIGSHVIQLPANDSHAGSRILSASVHAADECGDLDVCALQQTQRERSFLSGDSPDDVLQCFQYWEWTAEDRVPYTFPTKH